MSVVQGSERSGRQAGPEGLYRRGMGDWRTPRRGPVATAWLERLTELAVSRAHPLQATQAAAAGTLRIGDAERDLVAEAVRTAFAEGRLDRDECSERLDRVLAARTLADLSGITADLPVRGLPPAAADTGRPVAAVFGKTVHRGPFVIAARTPVTVAGGELVLDLSDALVQYREFVIDAKVLAGKLRIVVPDGVEVVLSPSIQSGRHHVARRPACAPGAPVLRVEGTISLGRLEVRRSRRVPRRGRALDRGQRRALG